MSWQDDLRQLDQALAEGRVPADEYRKRRDQLLAAAAGGAPAAPEQPAPAPQQAPQPQQPGPPQQPPQAAPGQPGQPGQQPGPTGPGSGPFAAPFRWEPASEATQVVSGREDDNPDKTQVVSPQHNQDVARTQTFQPLQPHQQQPYPQQPQQHPGFQQTPPWQAAQHDAAPPGGQDNDGPLAAPNPTWFAQGREVFEPSGRGGGGKVVKILVAALVVVAVGVGVFFFVRSQGDDPGQADPGTSQTQAPAPSSTKPPQPKDDPTVADLPGTRDEYPDVKVFDDAAKIGFLTTEEARVYTTGGAGRVRLTTSKLPDDLHARIFTAELGSATNAANAVTALGTQQVQYGMKAREDAPKDVAVHQIEKTDANVSLVRAHYVHKNTVVRIEVYGPDQAKVQTAFEQILTDQVEALTVG